MRFVLLRRVLSDWTAPMDPPAEVREGLGATKKIETNAASEWLRASTFRALSGVEKCGNAKPLV
jgi:hypothetical protein